MSRMSELHIELSNQAFALGFQSIEDAEQHGWRVNYETAKLEPPVVQASLNEMEELEKAHEEWCAGREELVVDLEELIKDLEGVKDGWHMTPDDYKIYTKTLRRAIKFIEDGEV